MTPRRIVFFGYSDVGHACLRLLLERGETVAAVYTHADNASENLWFPSVANLAREKKVPVRTPDDVNSPAAAAEIRALSPDLIFSFYYRSLIPAAVLQAAPLGAFNMHGSLLPRYRGRAPVNWAVLNGETRTGATLHVMTEKADAGDIVDQEAVPIGPDDTAAVVQARVTRAAVAVLGRQIDNLKAGRAPRHPQDAAQATYFGRRRPEDGQIHWDRPAASVHNLVRAVSHPYPGAFGILGGRKVIVWSSRLVSAGGAPMAAGEARLDVGRLLVGCGGGNPIEVLNGQIEGREPMNGADLGRTLLNNAVIKKAGAET